MGYSGDQIHIASIDMIDDAIRGAFLNNVQFSVMQNNTVAVLGADPGVDGLTRSTQAAYTLYLSYESNTWSDDSVIAAFSTPLGGGNGNLVCRRSIKTNETGSTVAEQLGPVHVWIEGTDVSADTPAYGAEAEARVTLTAWGRMILLNEDF